MKLCSFKHMSSDLTLRRSGALDIDELVLYSQCLPGTPEDNGFTHKTRAPRGIARSSGASKA